MHTDTRSNENSTFRQFLVANDIDPLIYDTVSPIPRYVRVKPGSELSADDVIADLGSSKAIPVPWLPNFLQIDGECGIASSVLYRDGKIYGIDASSGAAVMALNCTSGDRVLDLCCAPGAKLCMIADLIGQDGVVDGVDISLHRLTSCRTMLSRYKTSNARLFLADGTKFSPPVVNKVQGNTAVQNRWLRLDASAMSIYFTTESGLLPKLQSKKKKKYFAKQISLQDRIGGPFEEQTPSDIDTAIERSGLPYDSVLVDAECTHDASLKHLAKHEKCGFDWDAHFGPERQAQLEILQRQLILNGFHLVKSGGILVYSTCSYTRRQNEDIVQWLLRNETTAELVDIDVPSFAYCPAVPGLLPRTLRFSPAASRTGGLFIAKLRKNEQF